MSSSPSTQPSTPAHATLTLAGKDRRLEMRCPSANNLREDRTLTADDEKAFQDWSARHLKLAKHHGAAALLKLGQEMGAWLEGKTSDLTRIVKTGNAPAVLAFIIEKDDDSSLARAFLDAPWELLALPGQPRHLALREDVVLTVLRRIGPAQPEVPAASAHRLNAVFMAAAPRDADNLDWEAEETAILTATQHMPLDLVVEESGTLDLLEKCVAREKPDVVQISCHGTLEPKPGLFLEDDVGDEDFVSADRLIEKLAVHHPRLLFVSACKTTETHSKLNSLAQSLVRSGAQSVLGWAASVYDTEATLFGSHLLDELAHGRELAQACAQARLALAEHEQLKETTDGSPRSRHWHLARLYLSPTGGGSLATADGPHRLQGHGQAAKTFLDMKGSQVPVASDLEFVGRRREVQGILREFRSPASQRHAGILIHGMGRQGKSSLAARVARRMEQSHEVVVLFGRYDAAAILVALRERLGTEEVVRIVEEYLPRVEKDPALLQTALRELLKDCRLPKDDKNYRRPVLLIVDDFEQALEAHTTGTHTVRTELVESIRAVIAAFKNADTQSRLLFTSRFEFTLPDAQGKELAGNLLSVPLRGMNDREAQKQALAKLRQQTGASKKHQTNLPILIYRLSAIMAAAQGSPGLQDLLFSLCLEDPTACDTCLDELEDYRESGTAPTADKLRQFLENLAINSLLDLLTPPVRKLLRASTLFEVPVPVAVMEALAHSPTIRTDTHAITRLVELGLWEVYEDLHDSHQRALAVNALVSPLAGRFTDEEKCQHATPVTLPLFESWGMEAGAEKRKFSQDLELTRLALLAREPRVLAVSAARTLRALGEVFEYKLAAAWAQESLAILDAAGVPASVGLLRAAAARCQQVCLVQEARVFRTRALARLEQLQHSDQRVEAKDDDFDHAGTLIDHARALIQEGELDEALGFFEQAHALLSPGSLEQVHVLGDIARIQETRGEIDRALATQEQSLATYRTLDFKRGVAITASIIARIHANNGRVEKALALYEEALAIQELLGDRREHAITLGFVARIRTSHGEEDKAMTLHQQRLAIFEAVGDEREYSVALGDIARLQAAKGEVDGPLDLQWKRLGILERLGDKSEFAGTLVDIARLREQKGELDEALAQFQEALAMFRVLGDKRSCAVTLGDLGNFHAARGNADKALEFYQQRLQIARALKDVRDIAESLLHIAKAELYKQAWQSAYDHLQQSYALYHHINHLDGICSAALNLGMLLHGTGHRAEGLALLREALAGFQKMNRLRESQEAKEFLEMLLARDRDEMA